MVVWDLELDWIDGPPFLPSRDSPNHHYPPFPPFNKMASLGGEHIRIDYDSMIILAC